MKKSSILLTGILALAAFTACDDAPEAAAPQKNPQPAIFATADVTASPSQALLSGQVNLADAQDEGIVVIMDNIDYTNVPAGADITFELQISPAADFAVLPEKPLRANAENGQAYLFVDEWNEAHRDLFGKGLDPVTVFYRVLGYVSLDNSLYLIANPGQADANEPQPVIFAEGTLTETPYEVVEARPEYIVVSSQQNGWSMTSSNTLLYYASDKNYFCGASVVDNIYGYKFVWSNVWYGGSGEDGVLIGGDGASNINAPVDGTNLFWFTVNTDDLTYTVSEITSLGLIGVGNAWTPDTDVIEMTTADGGLTWTVDTHLSDGWKIIINKSWDSNYGGDIDGLTFGGDNITGYDGEYTVTLSFQGNNPTLTLTAK